MIDEKRSIIFFDGVCHLCNGFVDYLIQRQTHTDLAHQFYFAPLQGETAKDLLPSEFLSKLETVLVFHDGKILQASEAILFCFSRMPWPYCAMTAFTIIPAFLRDRLYFWVARNRYIWFGKRDLCRIPTPEEKNLLLP
jgi:predicted DCC family thiol-disulfide oxidoreductase YuxK